VGSHGIFRFIWWTTNALLVLSIVTTFFTVEWEASASLLVFSLLMRFLLAWLADHRLRIPRHHLRTSLRHATASFFSTPEIK
jgi:hypothetical protein